MCTCGCRLPAGTCGMMNCQGKASQLAKVNTLVSEGKSRDEVIATFVQDFGGQYILARPIDEGYHRLLWILPYTVAALTRGRAVAAGAPLVDAAAATTPVPAMRRRRPRDAGLQQQLDDELRDLD